MKSNQLLILSINEKTFALYLLSVERVIQAVEITSIIKSPEIILGIINYQGEIIPVINTRKLFSLPEREIDITDKFVIANTSKRRIALVVDEVHGITEYSSKDLVKPEQIVSGPVISEGIIKRNEEIIIYDIDSFIGITEDKKLDNLLNSHSFK